MVLQCSNHGDIGSFSEMTIQIGSIRSILEEEVRNRTKFENRRVLVPVSNTEVRGAGLDGTEKDGTAGGATSSNQEDRGAGWTIR